MADNNQIVTLNENDLDNLFSNSTPSTPEVTKDKTDNSLSQEFNKPLGDFLTEKDLEILENPKTTLTEDKKNPEVVDEPPVVETTSNISKNDSNSIAADSYKAVVDYWKQTGFLPEDLNIPEDTVIDDEFMAGLLDNLKQEYVQSYVQDALDLIGETGQKLVEYVNAGGDPNNIAELFKKRNEVLTIDITTDLGKRNLLTKYYQEELNWNDSRINKHLDRLLADDELDEEVTAISEKYQEVLDRKEQETIESQKKEFIKQQQQFQARKTNFENALVQKGVSKSEIQKSVDYVFQDKYKLKTGEMISEMDLQILKIQSNPVLLVDFVNYLQNPEEFITNKVTQAKNKDNEKKFKMIPPASKKIDSPNDSRSSEKKTFKLF